MSRKTTTSARPTIAATSPAGVTTTHTIQYWSVDNAGNVESTHTATIRVDSTAPTTADSTPGGWITSIPVTVTLSAVDTASGVSSTLYQINGAAVTTYTAPFTVSTPGTTTLSYASADIAGNRETTKTVTLRVDSAPPATGDNAPAGWSRTPVSVTLVASDAVSGVAATRYRIGAGAPATYTAPIGVAAEGTTTLSYWSIDAAGNTEPTRTATVRIDSLAPVTSDDVPAGWQTAPVPVDLTAVDAVSGVASTRYTLDGGAAATYTAPFTISTQGTTTIAFSSADNAGNRESTHTVTVLLDSVAPTTADDAPAGWLSATTATVTLTATDGVSGLAFTKLSVDGGVDATYTAPIAVSTQGTTQACASTPWRRPAPWRSTTATRSPAPRP